MIRKIKHLHLKRRKKNHPNFPNDHLYDVKNQAVLLADPEHLTEWFSFISDHLAIGGGVGSAPSVGWGLWKVTRSQGGVLMNGTRAGSLSTEDPEVRITTSEGPHLELSNATAWALGFHFHNGDESVSSVGKSSRTLLHQTS